MSDKHTYLPAELRAKALAEAKAVEELARQEVITPEQWARILGGRKVRYLIGLTDEQQIWAVKHARKCISCDNASDVKGDPRRGWCLVHRFLVSDAYAVLCQHFDKT